VLLLHNPEINMIEPFEVLMKTVVNYKDLIYNNNAEFVFSLYIEKLILTNLSHSYVLKRTKDNDLVQDLFFNKLESCLDDQELSFHYKLVFLMIILLHSDTKTNTYDTKNLMTVIYSNYIKLYEALESVEFIKIDDYSRILNYINEKLDLKYSELYETIILCHMRFKDVNFSNKNILVQVVEMLMKVFEINKDIDHKALRDKIFNKLK
jgi:hypothetical protein